MTQQQLEAVCLRIIKALDARLTQVNGGVPMGVLVYVYDHSPSGYRVYAASDTGADLKTAVMELLNRIAPGN